MGNFFSSSANISPISNNSPQELFVEIFSFLGHFDIEACSLVCRNWKTLVDGYFRQDILERKQLLEVFKFLGRNEVDKCQLVAKTWNGVVKKHGKSRLPLRPVYYSMDQRQNNGVVSDSLCDLSSNKNLTLERTELVSEVNHLINGYIKNVSKSEFFIQHFLALNFRFLPTGLRDHLYVNNIPTPSELSIFYDGGLNPASLELELFENIQHLRFTV